jgi:D-alanyl-D-alanine carboxypeptidase
VFKFFLTLLCFAIHSAKGHSSLVIDASSRKILYGENIDVVIPPASITKALTACLIFDSISSGKLKWTDKIKISSKASKQEPGVTGLPAGTLISVEDAMMALLLKSANDIAIAFAEHLDGSEQSFVERMNKRAKDIGMNNTSFGNPSGLPNARNLTTARDIGALGLYILDNYKPYKHLFSVKEYKAKSVSRSFRNHNKNLLDSGFDGIKTGLTNASGFCLLATKTANNRTLISVMLGGLSRFERDDRIKEMTSNAFNGIPINPLARIRSKNNILIAKSIQKKNTIPIKPIKNITKNINNIQEITKKPTIDKKIILAKKIKKSSSKKDAKLVLAMNNNQIQKNIKNISTKNSKAFSKSINPSKRKKKKESKI